MDKFAYIAKEYNVAIIITNSLLY